MPGINNSRRLGLYAKSRVIEPFHRYSTAFLLSVKVLSIRGREH